MLKDWGRELHEDENNDENQGAANIKTYWDAIRLHYSTSVSIFINVLSRQSSQVKFNHQLCGQNGRIAMWKWNKH